ncbi:MAG: hypothetical protein DRQ51_05735 [Gammaproteobacteria bacterium]|nr:MAG: hypothetical protein DRQ51_05735 [Gammaproteobacteria bacterium]
MKKENISQFFDNENIDYNDLKKIIESDSAKNKLWYYQLTSDALNDNYFLQNKTIYNNITKHIQDKEPRISSPAKKIFTFGFSFQAKHYAMVASLMLVLFLGLFYFNDATQQNFNPIETTVIEKSTTKDLIAPFFLTQQQISSDNFNIKGIPDNYKMLWATRSIDDSGLKIIEHRLYSNGKKYFSIFINKNQSIIAMKPAMLTPQNSQKEVQIINKNNKLITFVGDKSNKDLQGFISRVSME